MTTTTSAPRCSGGGDLESAYRASLILHAGSMISLVFFAVAIEMFKHIIQPAHAHVGMMKNIFFALGMGLFLSMKILRGMMLNRAPGDSLECLVGKLQRTSMVTAGLGQMPGVLGVCLFVLGGARVDSYILLAMSAAIYAAYFPRLSIWKEWLGSAAHTKT